MLKNSLILTCVFGLLLTEVFAQQPKPKSAAPAKNEHTQPAGRAAPSPSGKDKPTLPNVTIDSAKPTVARTCKWGHPIVSVAVTLTNHGKTLIPAFVDVLQAKNQAQIPWGGTGNFPELNPGASRTVTIELLPPSLIEAATGTHQFVVSAPLFKTQFGPIEVTIPPTLCEHLRLKGPFVFHPTPTGSGALVPELGLKGVKIVGGVRVNTVVSNEIGNLKLNFPVPQPTNLMSTTDTTTCANHGDLGDGGIGAAFACKAALPQGQLVLVWDPPAGQAQIDGYRVYEVDGGQNTLLGAQDKGKNFTLYILDAVPGNDYMGRCYAVVAYHGGDESYPTPPYCPGGGSTVQRATFLPDQVLATQHERSNTGPDA